MTRTFPWKYSKEANSVRVSIAIYSMSQESFKLQCWIRLLSEVAIATSSQEGEKVVAY